MLVLSVQHLENCLRHIEALGPDAAWDDRLLTLMKSYRSAFAGEQLKDLRDVLEHEEEFMAGGGRRRDSRVIVDELSAGLGFSSTDRIVSIRRFGRCYDVRHVVDAALALEEPLNTWWNGQRQR